jgi:hypothetical protein
VIAAMLFAAAPAPVYALSASTAANSASIINQVSAAGLSPNILVCRVVVVRHNGHLIVVRRCHRVERPI